MAEEDQTDGMPKPPTDFAGFKDLDRIGYVVSIKLFFLSLFFVFCF